MAQSNQYQNPVELRMVAPLGTQKFYSRETHFTYVAGSNQTISVDERDVEFLLGLKWHTYNYFVPVEVLEETIEDFAPGSEEVMTRVFNEEFLSFDWTIAGISEKASTILNNAGYTSLDDITEENREDILSLDGIGEKTVNLLYEYVENQNLGGVE